MLGARAPHECRRASLHFRSTPWLPAACKVRGLDPFISVHHSASSWLQMVDRMDQGSLPAQVCPNSYQALYGLVQKALFRTHVEGKLKSEIIKVATCPADRCVLVAAGVGLSPWAPAALLCACSCSRPQVALSKQVLDIHCQARHILGWLVPTAAACRPCWPSVTARLSILWVLAYKCSLSLSSSKHV